jgi:hypothetical protein
MGLIRQMGALLGMGLLFVILLVLGFSTGGTGWIAVALLCAWPMVFAVGAWSIRGLRDNYQVVPKAARQRTRPGEILG